eukprot:GHVH01005975.1.p1 GENE.GHVH01005975.1~~GHVH01005975.1.p1  ORF type:complete len:307 (+),score=17.16 GHVH01005975.1:40-960(+)
MLQHELTSSKHFYMSEVITKVSVVLLPLCFYLYFEPYEVNFAFTEQDRMRAVLEESVPIWLAFTLIAGISCLFLLFLIFSIIYNAKKKNLKRAVVYHQVSKVIISLLSTGIYTWAIVEPLKRFASEPRPHFLARCYGGLDNIPLLEDLPPHITNEICMENYDRLGRTGELTLDLLDEDRLSFPSAHSAFTTAIFLWMGLFSFYLSNLVNIPGYSTVGGGVLVLLSAPLFFVTTSRVRDQWHFAHDVLGGIGIGAAITAWQYLSYFPLEKSKTGAKAFFQHKEEHTEYNTTTKQDARDLKTYSSETV